MKLFGGAVWHGSCLGSESGIGDESQCSQPIVKLMQIFRRRPNRVSWVEMRLAA